MVLILMSSFPKERCSMFETAMFMELMAKLVKKCHEMSKSKGFWDEQWNFGEKIALIHSELSEALEAHREGTDENKLSRMSEKITDIDGKPYPLITEELADAVIRICDLCGKMGLNLGGAILVKMEYNSKRPHKHNKGY